MVNMETLKEINSHANLINNSLIGEYGIRFSFFFWDYWAETGTPEIHYDLAWTKGESKYTTNDAIVKLMGELVNNGYTENIRTDDAGNVTHVFFNSYGNYGIRFEILECFD